MIDLVKALQSIRPNCQWTLSGNEYEGLTWLDENTPKPTEAELIAEAERLQPIIECQVNRARAYPSIADQLDTLYHGGYDAWKAQIQAVKEQFPKGE